MVAKQGARSIVKNREGVTICCGSLIVQGQGGHFKVVMTALNYVVQMQQIGPLTAAPPPPSSHTSYMRIVQSRAEINDWRSRHIGSQAATIIICISTVASKWWW